jgi:disulfide bond formation protein DsbB
MKLEGRIFLAGAAFYLLLAVIYGLWSLDFAGFLLLAFTGLLAVIIAFFVLHTARRVYPRPEDNPNADQESADPDYGFYSPHSWWPLPVAASCALIVLGVAFAAWMVVAGVAFLFLSLIGFVFEYYRGDHAH